MEHLRYFFSLQMEPLPFSYIWFKYGILSMSWCKLCSVVVTALNFNPSQPGSIPAWGANVWNGRIRSIDAICRIGRGIAWKNLFFASKPCITVRVGAAMPAWGIAIKWQQLFIVHDPFTRKKNTASVPFAKSLPTAPQIATSAQDLECTLKFKTAGLWKLKKMFLSIVLCHDH